MLQLRSEKVDRVVWKLNQLVGNRFGVVLQYVSVDDRAQKHSGLMETAKRNAGAPMIVAHNKLIVPMRVEGSLVGATQVNDIRGVAPHELSQIKDTIDLVLGEVLNAEARSEFTEDRENIEIAEAQKNGSNVISFLDWILKEVESENDPACSTSSII